MFGIDPVDFELKIQTNVSARAWHAFKFVPKGGKEKRSENGEEGLRRRRNQNGKWIRMDAVG